MMTQEYLAQVSPGRRWRQRIGGGGLLLLAAVALFGAGSLVRAAAPGAAPAARSTVAVLDVKKVLEDFSGRREMGKLFEIQMEKFKATRDRALEALDAQLTEKRRELTHAAGDRRDALEREIGRLRWQKSFEQELAKRRAEELYVENLSELRALAAAAAERVARARGIRIVLRKSNLAGSAGEVFEELKAQNVLFSVAEVEITDAVLAEMERTRAAVPDAGKAPE